jgi:sterol desaturase/sphingolipid hydroxylase (fatty acid hydroxylase superfamily)
VSPRVATLQYHHWHHAVESEAVDKNFAVHLPVIDWAFGTFYLPGDRWPARYGLEGDPVPESYARQLVYPFLRGGGPFLRR